MPGTGNLLLKKKVGINAANDGGMPDAAVLAEGMPAVQLVGLPPVIEVANGSGLYPGHPLANVSNRLWVGMNRTAWTETNGAGSSGWAGTGPSVGVFYGTSITNQGATRPLWMGAEIRAHTPLVKGGANPTSSDALTYTVLKASWDPVTNDYLEGFDPATAGPSPTIFASDVVLVTQRAIYQYVEGRFAQNAAGLNTTFATKSEAAILGSDGALKGAQTFLSPINIEQKLTVNGYSQNSVNYPATIYSDNAEASVFDNNVTDLSIGGSATYIDIGNQSTQNDTTTTVHGSLVVTGDINISSTSIIDGGTY